MKFILWIAFIAMLSATAVGATTADAKNSQKQISVSQTAQRSAVSAPLVRFEKMGGRTYVVGTVLIDAAPDSVWDILVDYHNAPEVFKNLKSCEVVGHRGETKLVRQRVETGSPIHFDYVVALVEERPNRIRWARDSGSLKEVTGSWQLEPVDEGKRTRTTYSIYIDGGLLLPPWLLAPQLKGYMPVVLTSLRQKAERLAAASKPETSKDSGDR